MLEERIRETLELIISEPPLAAMSSITLLQQIWIRPAASRSFQEELCWSNTFGECLAQLSSWTHGLGSDLALVRCPATSAIFYKVSVGRLPP